jgi:hypothetical protein
MVLANCTASGSTALLQSDAQVGNCSSLRAHACLPCCRRLYVSMMVQICCWFPAHWQGQVANPRMLPFIRHHSLCAQHAHYIPLGIHMYNSRSGMIRTRHVQVRWDKYTTCLIFTPSISSCILDVRCTIHCTIRSEVCTINLDSISSHHWCTWQMFALSCRPHASQLTPNVGWKNPFSN